MTRKSILLAFSVFIILTLPFYEDCKSQSFQRDAIVDQQIAKFLEKMKGRWTDLNVSEEDGKILFEIVVKNKYRRTLEIGTSTGHSAIWIAWALSKTGGKLITIEIDEKRFAKALKNFKEAGVADLIDARLADAHDLVKKLQGTFDFIFIDADKEWYLNYAKALIPKLEPGGCIAAHNVRSSPFSMPGIREYYDYMKSHPEFETSLHPDSPVGMAVSYKKREPGSRIIKQGP